MNQTRICANALKRWRKGDPDWMREINSAPELERKAMIRQQIAPEVVRVMQEAEKRGVFDVYVTPYETVRIHPHLIGDMYFIDPEWRDLMDNRRRWRGKRSKRVREKWAEIERQIMDKSKQAFIDGKELGVFGERE